MLTRIARRRARIAAISRDQPAPRHHRHRDAVVRAHATEGRLPSVDLFKGFHAERPARAARSVARKVVERLVLAPVEHGRTYSYAEL